MILAKGHTSSPEIDPREKEIKELPVQEFKRMFLRKLNEM
jgi:hypothetical protein